MGPLSRSPLLCTLTCPRPYSFIVFLPENREPALQCLSLIEESHFKRRQVVVLAMEHEYRHGYQHVT